MTGQLSKDAKEAARKMYRAALNRGEIVRPKACQRCGCPCRPDGHHTDYSRPLDVEWLCKPCHREEHPRGTPGAGGRPRTRQQPSVVVTTRLEPSVAAALASLAKSCGVTRSGMSSLIVTWALQNKAMAKLARTLATPETT